MPCWTQTETLVLFGEQTDPKLIHAALTEMGLNPRISGSFIEFNTGSYNKATHSFTFRGASGERHSEEIKQAYSAEVIKAQAKRFGWQVKAKSKYDYVVTKRSI